jgi:hypothetical protein
MARTIERLPDGSPQARGGQPGQPQLTWYITAGGDALYERIWINSVSGALAYNYSQITEARNRRTFDGKDGSIISSTPARNA